MTIISMFVLPTIYASISTILTVFTITWEVINKTGLHLIKRYFECRIRIVTLLFFFFKLIMDLLSVCISSSFSALLNPILIFILWCPIFFNFLLNLLILIFFTIDLRFCFYRLDFTICLADVICKSHGNMDINILTINIRKLFVILIHDDIPYSSFDGLFIKILIVVFHCFLNVFVN